MCIQGFRGQILVPGSTTQNENGIATLEFGEECDGVCVPVGKVREVWGRGEGG